MGEVSYGALCFIPVACVLITALITKRTVEPLLFGTLVGWLIIEKEGFLWSTVDSALGVAGNPDTMYIVVICGLFGSLIGIIQKSGGATAFARFMASKVKGQRSALLCTWILGVLIFVDDYLNCLAVGSTMRKVTDQFKVPRAALAYVVASTAAPVCLLIPMSTWAVYIMGLIEKNGFAESGEGISLYVKAIPFAFYPLVAVVLVLLFALKIVPVFGPMKKAYKRVEESGQLYEDAGESKMEEEVPDEGMKLSMVDFFIPMAVLLAVALVMDTNLLYGVSAAVLIGILIYVPRKKISLIECFTSMMEGFKSMIEPVLVVVTGLMLVEVNDILGLTPYIINWAEPYLSGIFFAAIVFVIEGAIGFLTSSNWGAWAIMIPIVIPLANVAGVPAELALGAMIAGGGFGGHACMWGDTTVLAAAGSGLTTNEHVRTQLPYALVGAGITIVLFIGVSIFLVG